MVVGGLRFESGNCVARGTRMIVCIFSGPWSINSELFFVLFYFLKNVFGGVVVRRVR